MDDDRTPLERASGDHRAPSDRVKRLRVVAAAAITVRTALAREPVPDPVEINQARAALNLALDQLVPGDLDD